MAEGVQIQHPKAGGESWIGGNKWGRVLCKWYMTVKVVPWFSTQGCLQFFCAFIVQISLLFMVGPWLASLEVEKWKQELKIAAVSLTPANTTQVSTFPSWNKCGKKAEGERKSRGGKSTDALSIYFSTSHRLFKCPWASCTATFSEDPLVMTTPSFTSLPKKVKRHGAQMAGINKCWLCGLGSITGWTEKKKLSRTTRANHPWPPLNHPLLTSPVMYTLHSSPEDFFLNIFIFVAFMCSHMRSCAKNMRIFFLWRLPKIISIQFPHEYTDFDGCFTK